MRKGKQNTLVGRSVLLRRGWLPVSRLLLEKARNIEEKHTTRNEMRKKDKPVWCAAGAGHCFNAVYRCQEKVKQKR